LYDATATRVNATTDTDDVPQPFVSAVGLSNPTHRTLTIPFALPPRSFCDYLEQASLHTANTRHRLKHQRSTPTTDSSGLFFDLTPVIVVRETTKRMMAFYSGRELTSSHNLRPSTTLNSIQQSTCLFIVPVSSVAAPSSFFLVQVRAQL
jgi:hypothetical protein